MNLTIDNLKAAGAFTGAPVAKEIEWEMDGEKHEATVFVRRIGYAAAVSDLMAFGRKTDPTAARIAATICDASGVAIFTPDDITHGPVVLDKDSNPVLDENKQPQRTGGSLDRNLVVALLNAMGEVNGAGKTKS